MLNETILRAWQSSPANIVSLPQESHRKKMSRSPSPLRYALVNKENSSNLRDFVTYFPSIAGGVISLKVNLFLESMQ